MATNTRISLREFLARPETEPASEYVCGEVIQKTMPTRAHGITQARLSHAVYTLLDTHDLGEAGSEIRYIFGPPGQERAYVPDFAFVRAERLPADAELNDSFHGAPDLAVEILSPADRPGRVHEKVDFYLRHGVRRVWLVDPEERSVRVCVPDEDVRTLEAGDLLDGGDLLPGFSVAVADLFPRVRP